MANVIRNQKGIKIPAATTLASTDDLNGTVDGTQYLSVPRGSRVLIVQMDDSAGADGTAGVDVIEISTAGGAFIADPTIMALAEADQGGTLLASAALNAAGVEPGLSGAIFKSGPYGQAVRMRCARGGSGAGGTAWVTTAPSVRAILIQGKN